VSILAGSTDWKPAVAGSEKASEQQKVVDKFRHKDPINRQYNTARWHKVSELCRRSNPICQKIVNDATTGESRQCHNPSSLAHHIRSPRCGGAMLDLKNLLALCANCHPSDEGTPNWVVGKDFVASNYPRWTTGQL
jgi:hypothetical protein